MIDDKYQHHLFSYVLNLVQKSSPLYCSATREEDVCKCSLFRVTKRRQKYNFFIRSYNLYTAFFILTHTAATLMRSLDRETSAHSSFQLLKMLPKFYG